MSVDPDHPAITAAHRAVDPEWGNDAADRHTVSLEVARQWVREYEALLAFDQKSLRYMLEKVQDLSPLMRSEIELTNIPIMHGQIKRVKTRLGYWQDRERELLTKEQPA